MTKLVRGVLVGAVAITCWLAAGCAAESSLSDPPEASEIRAGVEDAIDSYLSAISQRDEEALRSLLAGPDRYLWAEDGEPRYRSVDDVITGLASFPQEMPIETELSDLRIVAVGRDGAHAAARFETRIGSGEQAFAFGGYLTFVLERAGDGWRIVAGHASSAGPNVR